MYTRADLERAKELSMQERQPSPTESYEDVEDRLSEDSMTPLHSVNSWLNIPTGSREIGVWGDRTFPRRSEYDQPGWLAVVNGVFTVLVSAP